MINFDINLKNIRDELKATQTEIADKLGISLRQYQRHEKNPQNLTMSQIAEFADKLGISIDKFTNGDNLDEVKTKIAQSTKINEFLELYEKYGNADLDALLDPIIERLKKIKEFSNPQT